MSAVGRVGAGHPRMISSGEGCPFIQQIIAWSERRRPDHHFLMSPQHPCHQIPSRNFPGASRRGVNDFFSLFVGYLRRALPSVNVVARNGALPGTPAAYMAMCLDNHADAEVGWLVQCGVGRVVGCDTYCALVPT